MRWLVLAALAGCVPEPEVIGTTAWSRAIEGGTNLVRGGSARHVVVTGGRGVVMRGPDGSDAWIAAISGEAVDGVVDARGGAVLLHRRDLDPATRASTLSRFAPDGTLAWAVDRAADLGLGARLVLDAEDATWILNDDSRWERYDAAGTLVGRGATTLPVGSAAARPTGGIVVNGDGGRITGLDVMGTIQWQLEDTGSFVVHADGELTRIGAREIERYDATQVSRWRVPYTPNANPMRTFAALDDGSTVIAALENLGNRADGSFPALLRIDRDGAVTREVMTAIGTAEVVRVLQAPPGPGVRILIDDLRTGARLLVARELD